MWRKLKEDSATCARWVVIVKSGARRPGRKMLCPKNGGLFHVAPDKTARCDAAASLNHRHGAPLASVRRLPSHAIIPAHSHPIARHQPSSFPLSLFYLPPGPSRCRPSSSRRSPCSRRSNANLPSIAPDTATASPARARARSAGRAAIAASTAVQRARPYAGGPTARRTGIAAATVCASPAAARAPRVILATTARRGAVRAVLLVRRQSSAPATALSFRGSTAASATRATAARAARATRARGTAPATARACAARVSAPADITATLARGRSVRVFRPNAPPVASVTQPPASANAATGGRVPTARSRRVPRAAMAMATVWAYIACACPAGRETHASGGATG